MKMRTYCFIAFATIAICLNFLRDPGFGDDFTYWSFAFDLHEHGFDAWQKHSFHDLRWPVWLPIWIIQSTGFIGLAAYYLTPLIYMAIAAVITAQFAWRLTEKKEMAWAASMLLTLHPLLDSICYRPMPDLSEGVLGAATVAAWWRLMHAGQRGKWLWAALTGLCIFFAESNRLTGIFIIGVIGLNTLLFFRKFFGRILLASAFAALFYMGECCFYQWLFDDWLHNLHANLGGKGRKGTDAIHLLAMPFRFLDSLWKSGTLGPFYCLTALAGIFIAWRRHGVLGRVIVVWFISLYLAYACAPQQIWPWRPLLRDADRFLAGLVVPGAILAAVGCAGILKWLALRCAPLSTAIQRWPLACGSAGLIALFFISSRDRWDFNATHALRATLAALPEGTSVFTHEEMRHYAILASEKSAMNIHWRAFQNILFADARQHKAASESDQIWYIQKHLWYRARIAAERGTFRKLPELAPFLDQPESQWRITRVITKANTPDFVFLRARKPEDAPSQTLTAASPGMATLFPATPVKLEPPKTDEVSIPRRPVPESLRGKILYLDMLGAADKVEAVQVRLIFYNGKSVTSDYLLKPYWFKEASKFRIAVPVPAEADTFSGKIVFAKGTKRVQLDSFQVFVIHPE